MFGKLDKRSEELNPYGEQSPEVAMFAAEDEYWRPNIARPRLWRAMIDVANNFEGLGGVAKDEEKGNRLAADLISELQTAVSNSSLTLDVLETLDKLMTFAIPRRFGQLEDLVNSFVARNAENLVTLAKSEADKEKKAKLSQAVIARLCHTVEFPGENSAKAICLGLLDDNLDHWLDDPDPLMFETIARYSFYVDGGRFRENLRNHSLKLYDQNRSEGAKCFQTYFEQYSSFQNLKKELPKDDPLLGVVENEMLGFGVLGDVFEIHVWAGPEFMKLSREDNLGMRMAGSLENMIELEKLLPGSVIKLHREYGVKCFFRYPPEILANQLKDEGKLAPRVAIFFGTNDYGGMKESGAFSGGAFTKRLSDLDFQISKSGGRLCVFEASDEGEMEKCWKKAGQIADTSCPGGLIDAAVFSSHGSEEGLELGLLFTRSVGTKGMIDTEFVRSSRFRPFLSLLRGGATVVLDACHSGDRLAVAVSQQRPDLCVWGARGILHGGLDYTITPQNQNEITLSVLADRTNKIIKVVDGKEETVVAETTGKQQSR